MASSRFERSASIVSPDVARPGNDGLNRHGKLVEAAGVEPASEKVNREKTTCVSGSVVLVRLIRYRQESDGLARLISAFPLRTEASDLSCKMTPVDRVQAHRPGAATQLIKQRKQTADYWQLLFSDRFTGARNPARLPTTDTIPSNPLRPLSPSF